MRRTLIYSLTLLTQTAAAVAQTAPPDSQMTQTMLTEIRQLRHDLQAAAAVIQRVQIVMYRLQTETAVLDRITQRLSTKLATAATKRRCSEEWLRPKSSRQKPESETRRASRSKGRRRGARPAEVFD